MTDRGIDLERRVLLLAPTARDASTSQELLASAGLTIEACGSFDGLMAELERGAATILLPEEALSSERVSRVCDWLTRQPPWSDLPVLILARTGANSAASREAVRTLGNVTLLERPLQVATLVSAVRTALRARERQWQIRGHLIERAHAEESLRRADQRKDEFLATLGHELRNPLAPLMTGLQLLNTSAAADSHVREISVIMNRQLRHLVRLVDDLLEVSRITRGLVDIEREPVDLGFVLRSAVDTCQPALDAARHTLTVDLPGTPVTVAGDAVRLTQVFSNLLANAAKYTNTGGHVWVTLRHEGGAAIASVRDDGIGISLEHLGSVFEMFVQVDRSNRRAQGGLGIGLTLVRSLVALHGGTVEARSAGPGQGTEFVVELPVLSATAASARDLEPAGPFPSCRVLIVDDNCDAADTLGSLLAEAGVTVSVAHTGPDALRILPTFGPDVVLLDIGMPDMDGYAVARYIRSTPSVATVRLIALTGWGQDQDVQQARDAGFDHHLVKPPNLEKLRLMLLGECPPPSATPRRSAARA